MLKISTKRHNKMSKKWNIRVFDFNSLSRDYLTSTTPATISWIIPPFTFIGVNPLSFNIREAVTLLLPDLQYTMSFLCLSSFNIS